MSPCYCYIYSSLLFVDAGIVEGLVAGVTVLLPESARASSARLQLAELDRQRRLLPLPPARAL